MIFLAIILISIPICLIAALFIRKGFTVEQEIIVAKPITEVFNYLKLLKNQDQYYVRLMSDPKIKKEFTGTDGTVGFVYAWHSRNPKVGTVAMEITELREPDKVGFVMRFEKPFVSRALNSFNLTAINDNQTNIRWIYKSNIRPYYLLRVAHLLFRLKKTVSKRMQASLSNLKEILEK